MKLKKGEAISIHTIRAIIERNDLVELIALHKRIGIGTSISKETREWFFSCYLGVADNVTTSQTRVDWAMRSQVLDSILTHPEWLSRLKQQRDLTLAIEEVN